MLSIAPPYLRAVTEAAEAAYPYEACGLLLGRHEYRAGAPLWRVTRVLASANLAAEPERAFEIDMRLRLHLQRELRESADAVVGLYHSHPDGPAEPSATDLARAWEPELAWLVVAVTKSDTDARAAASRAYALAGEEGARCFVEIALHLAAEPLVSEPASVTGDLARLVERRTR